MKALVLIATILGTSLFANADYRCETRANGRSYSEVRRDYNAARRAVINECERYSGRRNPGVSCGVYRGEFGCGIDLGTDSSYRCESNVTCRYVDNDYGRGDDDFGRNRRNPPTVDSSYCYVAQTGQYVDGNRFFSLVHEWTKRNYRCAVAKISFVPYSGRIYDRDGSRVAKELGGLSNSEVDAIAGRYGLWGCERFTCEERGW